VIENNFTLFTDVVANANMEVDGLADELQRQKEESRQQHEEIAILASKLLHAESQINKVSNIL
jgi:trafficking kinesin-binding protein 1